MSSAGEKNYYVERLPALLKEYDVLERQLAVLLGNRFPPSKAEQLLVGVRRRVSDLLVELPYIGGDSSPLTQMLVRSAFALPWFLSFEEEGLSMRDIAGIWYEARESIHLSESAEERQRKGEFHFSDEMIDIVRREGERSRKREYAEDWVYEFVRGDGERFDYGYDITECGILKYYEHHGAERFVPIICLLDYASFGSLGVGFKRTRKLSTGDSFCEFRFKKGLRTPRGWPPDDLGETFPY